tara:strand:- start:421 stop:660 length:240 start_codon:yes stop_codon:yes gene_type:complete
MSSAIQFGKTRNFRADYIQDLLITLRVMEVTKEMLDAIEAVKGKRNPALWDPRCQKYLENKGKVSVQSVQKPVKTASTS